MSHVFNSLRKAMREVEDGSAQARERNEGGVFGAARVIPHIATMMKPESRILSGSERQSVAREHFKYLEHELRALRKRSPVKRILVTSSAPREGKTVVATNLATTLASGTVKVLLVDADMRGAGRGNLFGLGEVPGLADVLEGRTEAIDVLTYLNELNIYHAPSGTASSSPGDLVHGPGMGSFLKAMDEFDWIVIDSPPIAAFADALTLAGHADTVLLVARAGTTERQALQSAIEALKANHSNIGAVVLNASDRLRNAHGYYSYYKDLPREISTRL